MPALIALDPALQDDTQPDYAERLGYAQTVGDWLSMTVLPLIQMSGSRWETWMQMLGLATRAMVQRRLGPNPSLDAWRALALELSARSATPDQVGPAFTGGIPYDTRPDRLGWLDYGL